MLVCQVCGKLGDLANYCFVLLDLLTKKNQGSHFDDSPIVMLASTSVDDLLMLGFLIQVSTITSCLMLNKFPIHLPILEKKVC